MDDLARLVAIEEIKRLKALYFLHLDAQDWRAWEQEVWAPDAELLVPDVQPEPLVGAAQIAAWSRSMLAGRVTIHHGHSPVIDILSPDTATAVWAMEDRIHNAVPAGSGPLLIHGWGHYHERYVQLAQGWRISRSRLTRLRLDTCG